MQVLVFKIKDLANFYNISTDVEGCSITPLHYLFARYIHDDENCNELLQKIEQIDPTVTNTRTLVMLTKQGKSARKIEADSFRDGGLFLLWCLRYNRIKHLQYFLSDQMVQFWRPAQLKTALWACFQQRNEANQFQAHGITVLNTIMRSAAMRSIYAQLQTI